MNLKLKGLALNLSESEVSIPNRDFMNLKHLLCQFEAYLSAVSIPNRDFMNLKHAPVLFHKKFSKFQSLIGIL